MARGTTELFTMWTPLDDVPVEMGTLAMCEGSHRLPGYIACFWITGVIFFTGAFFGVSLCLCARELAPAMQTPDVRSLVPGKDLSAGVPTNAVSAHC